MKHLIVNADDFGLTHGVNRAIIACHQRGIVSSTTLMATGGAFDEAVSLAAALPGLTVGCHIVLVDGQPLLPPSEVRSLLAPGTDRFYHTIGEVLQAVAVGRFRAEEIKAEAKAQMAKMKASGVVLSHFDAHKHTHMFPSILRPLLLAAGACGVTSVRNPFEAPGATTWAESLRDRKLCVRKLETSLLRAALRPRWLRAVRSAGFTTTDGSLGVAATGALNADSLRTMLRRMPPGTWELVCHPGYNDRDLAAVRTKLRDSREIELAALQSITPGVLWDEFGAELFPFALDDSPKPALHGNI